MLPFGDGQLGAGSQGRRRGRRGRGRGRLLLGTAVVGLNLVSFDLNGIWEIEQISERLLVIILIFDQYKNCGRFMSFCGHLTFFLSPNLTANTHDVEWVIVPQ